MGERTRRNRSVVGQQANKISRSVKPYRMQRITVNEKIKYLVPDSMKNFSACAGIIVKGRKKILIDTNMGPSETAALFSAEQPDIAISSHYHLDHSAWCWTALSECDAVLYIPEIEAEYYRDFNHFIKMTCGPYGLGKEWREFAYNVTGFREVSKFETYTPDVEFDVGGSIIKCLPSPGHSPGHTSFYLPDEKILFTGDMGIDRFGPWYGWFDCDLFSFIDSILRLKSMETEILITSHGGILKENIGSAWDKCLAFFIENERSVASLLEKGTSSEEIVSEGLFYKGKEKVGEPMRSFLYMWDDMILKNHEKCLKNGSLESYINKHNSFS